MSLVSIPSDRQQALRANEHSCHVTWDLDLPPPGLVPSIALFIPSPTSAAMSQNSNRCLYAPLPMTEDGLVHFVAFAVQQGLKYQTYLAAVRHLQVSCGMGDPKMGDMPQLGLALCSARKEKVGEPQRTRLPITPMILLRMRQETIVKLC